MVNFDRFNPKNIPQSLYDSYPREGLAVSKYAEHRKKVELPGAAHQTVKRAIERGLITKNKYGKIYPKEADLAWFNNADMSRNPNLNRDPNIDVNNYTQEDGEPIPYMVSHARHEEIKVQIAQLKLDELEGTLVNKDEVYGILFNHYRVIRDRMLNIPVRLAPILGGIDDVTDVEHKLEDAIINVLEELSNESRKLNNIEEN